MTPDHLPLDEAAADAPSGKGNLHDVYLRLREAILDGTLAGGETINQVQLSRRFGVSRTPVREALRNLEAEGLVEFRPNRGVVIRDLSATEVRELFLMRLPLELLAATQATLHADEAPLDNLELVINRSHLSIGALVASAYASGLSTLVEDETDLGVTVIDMGAGTTSIAVFSDGEMVYADIVPVGGAHVTNDIARGLSTPITHAERLKTLHGAALATPDDEHGLIDVLRVGEDEHNSPNHIPRSLLNGIIHQIGRAHV